MAITVQSVSTNTRDGAYVDVDNPASLAVGDLLIAQVVVRDTGFTFTTPSGWTLIHSGYVDTSSPGMASFYRIVNGSEGSTTRFTINSSTRMCGAIAHIKGAHATTPIGTASETYNDTASTTATGTTVTPSVADSMIVMMVGTGSGGAVSGYALATSSPSFTEQWDFTEILTTCAMATGIRPETTATGNATATITSGRNAVHLFPIIPGLITASTITHDLSLLGVGT